MEKEQNKKRLVVATGNIHKLREIAEIFPEYEVISGKQAGFSEEVEETGTTFAENAKLKAEAVSKALHCIALADDSGICVEALGGAPGVYSARYAGGHGDDKANRLLLLKNMEGETNRRAYFESAVLSRFPTVNGSRRRGGPKEKSSLKRREKTGSVTIVFSRATI